MRREFLLFVLVFAMLRADLARAQSLSPKSSKVDLNGLTKKASAGNIEAQFKLAQAYQFGLGVEKDLYEAVRWYRMAANSGNPSAQNNLGYLYATGPEGLK